MRFLMILVTGLFILTLMWTNPDETDFLNWVEKKESTNFPSSTPFDPVNLRSSNYMFFSVYELSIVRERILSEDQNNIKLMEKSAVYSGVGILGMIFPMTAPDVEGKQAPFFN